MDPTKTMIENGKLLTATAPNDTIRILTICINTLTEARNNLNNPSQQKHESETDPHPVTKTTDVNRILHALHYLLTKTGPRTKLEAVRLLYFADKYCLLKYGCLVSNDKMIATSKGPAGSLTVDTVYANEVRLHKEELEEIPRYLRPIIYLGHTKYEAIKDACDYNRLRETGKKAIDFVAKNFAALRDIDQDGVARKLPEWQQYEQHFREKRSPKDIEYINMFERGEIDWDVSENHAQLSKKLFLGKI